MVSDGTARRRLRLLIGSAALLAGACLAWALTRLPGQPNLAYLVMASAVIALADCGVIRMRVRSQHVITTTTPAILAAALVLPAPWAIISAAGGVAAAKALRRHAVPRPVLMKAVFNTAKETLGAAAAVTAVATIGVVPVVAAADRSPGQWGSLLLGLAAATLAYTVVDELVPHPVIAAASGTSWRQVASRDWDLRALTRLVDLAIAAAAMTLAVLDWRLLVVMPAVLVVAYVVYRERLRVREERRAWQQLTTATHALSECSADGDLTRLLQVAATRAAQLFPAALAEIQLDGRLIRASGQDGIDYDGPAAHAPPVSGPVTEAPLPPAPNATPGVALRLRFPRAADLAEREPYLLQTLAAALATEIRNTNTQATNAALAQQNSFEAVHDPLTGLPNRRQLREHTTALLQARPTRNQTAVLLVDLDHFKEINDSIGHAAGDTVLIEVARRLQQAATDGMLVARLGGDEFAIVSTPATLTAAQLHAERILATLHKPMTISGVPLVVEATAGLAHTADAPDIDYGELLRRADVALYRAKDATRPVRVAVYTPDHDRGAATLRLRAQVPRAAATGDWQLRHHPVVELDSGRAVAATAATHWPHPELERLPAGRILGILDRAGHLHTFTATLLDRAFAEAARWRDHGFGLTVAVTVTPRAITDPDFQAMVTTKLAGHQLDPNRLTLTLAHTVGALHSPASKRLAALRSAGVRIGLDRVTDTTLGDLYRLPVDEITLDAALITALDSPEPEAARAAAILQSLIDLGRHANIAVIADGIRYPRQHQRLWEMGATLGQGPMFGQALTPDQLLTALEHGYQGTRGVIRRPLRERGATVIALPTRRTGHK